MATPTQDAAAAAGAKPPPSPETGATPAPLWVAVAADSASLEAHVAAWDDLAGEALEPNAFFESWMLLPAVRAFGPGKDLVFVLVYRTDPRRPKGPPLLCGLFPLERGRRYKGLPVSCLSVWEYTHCFLATPLVRAQYAAECLGTFFDWLARDRRGASLVEFRLLAGDGPFYQQLVDLFRRRGTLTVLRDQFTRAFLRCRADADAYLRAALSANKRRDLQRKERRLTELGRLEYVTPGPGADVEAWLQDFLRLEAAGWKGQEGTALACQQADRAFFLEAAREGWRRGRLGLLGLRLDGRLIALRCNLLAPPGSFFYKPAYDEGLGRFSPGVLLEVDNIRRVHAEAGVEWMDSCTSPDNELLNALWLERRIMQTVVAATGRGVGRFVLSTLPLLRWANRLLGRYRPPDVPHG
jgi:CelD/BcsL family acetyltransferase involved in cellulose biosynthesis